MATRLCINNISNEEKGYLLGLFTGDGYLYYDRWRHYKVDFYFNQNKDMDIVKYLIRLLKKINLSPYLMYNHGCAIIRLNSKLFYFFLNNFHYSNDEISDEFHIGFISGLIDSDGCVRKGDIVISNKTKNLFTTIQLFCSKNHIKTRLWSQTTNCNGKKFIIWRLRIGTRFKYKQQYSRKILRRYGGGDCLP